MLNLETLTVVDIEVDIRLEKQKVIGAGFMASYGMAASVGAKAIKNIVTIILEELPKKNHFIYTHNFSNFDSYFIVKEMKQMEALELKRVFKRGSSIIFAEFKCGVKSIYLFDSYLFFSVSLSEIVKQYGWEKFYVTMSRKADLMLYMTFDVLTLYYFMVMSEYFYRKVYKISMLNYITIAHMSYNIYTKRFLKNVIKVVPDDVRTSLRSNYSTSRISVCESYVDNAWFYDVNSLYPYMIKKYMPTVFERFYYCKMDINYFFGFIECTVTKSGSFKVAGLDSGKILLLSEEFKFLVKIGYSFKIFRYYKFSREKIFDSFVDHFYLLKRYSGTKFLKHNSKIILNTLYWKFAAKTNPRNFLQLSVAICCYAKVEIYQYRMQEHFYSDTDSIVYGTEVAKKYVGPGLGLLKIVSHIDSGLFVKNYYTYMSGGQRIIKAKGVIKKITPVLNGNNYSFKLSQFVKNYSSLDFSVKEYYYRYKYEIVRRNKSIFSFGKNWFMQKGIVGSNFFFKNKKRDYISWF